MNTSLNKKHSGQLVSIAEVSDNFKETKLLNMTTSLFSFNDVHVSFYK